MPGAPETDRGRAKAQRRSAILTEAARLFAEDGYAGVSLEEIGRAVGVSGPAVYRHFPNKGALLAAVLIEVSERLLDGGTRMVREHADARSRLHALVGFHVDFAIADVDVIRVQDRDLTSLAEADRHTVRRLQREYVDLWVRELAAVTPDAAPAELRIRAHAVFGLINSTPYSVRTLRPAPAAAIVSSTLESMALAALLA